MHFSFLVVFAVCAIGAISALSPTTTATATSTPTTTKSTTTTKLIATTTATTAATSTKTTTKPPTTMSTTMTTTPPSKMPATSTGKSCTDFNAVCQTYKQLCATSAMLPLYNGLASDLCCATCSQVKPATTLVAPTCVDFNLTVCQSFLKLNFKCDAKSMIAGFNCCASCKAKQ